MKKAERLAQAKRDHEKYLKSVGYTGTKGKDYRSPMPSYKTEHSIRTSDRICAVATKSSSADKKERIERSKSYTIAPAYNKGGYQVIGKNNVKDIGR